MLSKIISDVDAFVWGPMMLVLLVGTGILLTIRCNFLTWRNLPWAIKKTLSKESRTKNRGEGDVSPFSALTTALAATIGTGNIVGVATAMVSGGAGALVWMWISACFGLSSKFSECMLAIKYREVNEKGEMSGGPMYTMKKALKNKKLGAVLGWLFALFAVIASFGIGNMTQGNSISTAVHETFGVSVSTVGAVITILALLIIIGGIKTISKVSSVVVPVMAIFYVIAGVIVILGNISNLPAGFSMIFHMAFSVKAVGGALCGNIVASMMNAARYGVASGSAGIYQYDRNFLGYDRCLYDHRSCDRKLRSAWTDRSGNRRDVHRFCINDCGIFHSSWKSWKISGNDRNCTFCIFHNSWMGVSWRKGV